MDNKIVWFLDTDEPASSVNAGDPGSGKSFLYYGGTGGGKIQFAHYLKEQYPDQVTILNHDQSSKSFIFPDAGVDALKQKYGIQKTKDLTKNIIDLGSSLRAENFPEHLSHLFESEQVVAVTNITEAIRMVSLCSGVSLNSSELLRLIDPDIRLCSSLLIKGAHDKSVIDQLLNSLSKFLLGRSWPVFTNRIDFKSFLIELHQAAESFGFKVRVNVARGTN